MQRSTSQHSLTGAQRKQTRATPARASSPELRGFLIFSQLFFLLIHAAILVFLATAVWEPDCCGRFSPFFSNGITFEARARHGFFGEPPFCRSK